MQQLGGPHTGSRNDPTRIQEAEAALKSLAPATLRTVIRVMLFAVTIWAVGVVTIFFNKPLTGALVASLLVATLISRWLLGRGSTFWASVVLLSAWWTASVIVVVLSGGLRSPALHMLLMPTIVAALIMGRAALGIAIGSIALVCTVLLTLDLEGIQLPVLLPGPPAALWLNHCVSLIVLGVVVRDTVVGLGASVALARREVEARTQAERSHRESEARLSAVIANSPSVAIQWYDQEGRVVLWNHASETMFGFSSAEARGKTLDQLIHTPQEGRQFLELLQSIGRTGEPFGPAEFSFRRRSGQTGVCLSTVFRIPGRDDTHWFVCMDVDVTELKKTQEQLHQAQKLQAIGQLAGGVAHDFNNILTVVAGYCEMLLALLPHQDGPARAAVAAIQDAGHRASMLTRQLLAFGRRQIVEPRIIDINQETSGIELLLRRMLGERIAVQFSLRADHPALRIDPAQLHQILLNLAVNARDAMPVGGRLIIETRNEPATPAARDGVPSRPEPDHAEHICLAVSDTGTGMTQEVQARIFEPFFTTKGPGKGTGLGLASVYGIVQQSSGHISVTSAPGAGTTFVIRWPLARGPISPQLNGDEHAEPLGGTETILLAEDDSTVRSLVATALRSAGYHVLESQTGEQALEIAGSHQHSIDLVVTDVVMPGLNGKDLVARLHQTLPSTKVLFMTGYADDESLHDGLVATSDAFIHKPFSPREIAAKVRQVLDSRPGPVNTAAQS